MAEKQTRRCISVSGELYQALKDLAVLEACGLSTLVEETMRARLGNMAAPYKLSKTYAAAAEVSLAPPPPPPVLTPALAPVLTPALAPAPAPPVAVPVVVVKSEPVGLPPSRFSAKLSITRPKPPGRYRFPTRTSEDPPTPPEPNAKTIFTF